MGARSLSPKTLSPFLVELSVMGSEASAGAIAHVLGEGLSRGTIGLTNHGLLSPRTQLAALQDLLRGLWLLPSVPPQAGSCLCQPWERPQGPSRCCPQPGPCTQHCPGPLKLWPCPQRSHTQDHLFWPHPSMSLSACCSDANSSPRLSPRVTKKKKTGKKKKGRSDEEASPLRPASAQHTGARRGDGDSRVSSPGLGRGSPDASLASPQEKGEGPSSAAEHSACSEPSQMGLLIPEMKDTSMEHVGQPLRKVIDQLNGQLDPRTWCSHVEPPDQPFRTGSPGDTPERPPFCDFSEGLPAPMDFYRFTVESPSTVTSGGGHHDPAGPSQPLHVPGGPAAAGQEEEGGGGGGEGEAPPPLGATLGEAQEPEIQVPPVKEGPGPKPESGTQEALCQLKRDQPSPCLSSAEDSGVEEGQGSPSEMSHSAEFR